MKIIIDTHIFLWALADTSKLSEQRLYKLQSPANIIYVSSMTIAELMIKSSIGKLEVDFNPVQAASDAGFELLDFTGEDALLLQHLPFHHKDPFDRMLVAQAMQHKMPIMTDDSKITAYDCRVI